MDSKTTRGIPPDLDSCKQHILRSHHRSFIWTHCDNHQIPNIDACLNGWKKNGRSLFPIWFVGNQYPVSGSKSQGKKIKGDAGDGDVSERTSGKNKRKKKRTESGYKFRKMVNRLSFDNDSLINLEKEIDSCSSDDTEELEDIEVTAGEKMYLDDSDWERLSDFVDDIISDSSDSD